MTADVHLSLARPRLEVALRGHLDARAAAVLADGVHRARTAGCPRIEVHLEGARSADEFFIKALCVLRHQCIQSGGSFEVKGLVLLSGAGVQSRRLHLVPAVATGEETHS